MTQLLGVVKQDLSTGLYWLEVNGARVSKSKHKDYFEYHLKRKDVPKLVELGVTDIVYSTDAPKPPAVAGEVAEAAHEGKSAAAIMEYYEQFHINERFDILESFVDMVARKRANSTVITGSGGLGKTFSVLKVMKELCIPQAPEMLTISDPTILGKSPDQLTLDEMMELDSYREAEAARASGYVMIKGYSTARSLYRTLYENRDSVIWFDDCDAVVKDPTAVDILKAALDSYDERWVTWNAEMAGVSKDLPRRFEFRGSVIFVSNMSMLKVPQAFISRSLPIDVSMTKAEIIERMEFIITSDTFMPAYDFQIKRDALDYLKSVVHYPDIKTVNLRSLVHTVKNRSDNKKNWQRASLYALKSAIGD